VPRGQTETQAALTWALEELRAGVAATPRMRMQRCEVREDSDGQVRAVGEPAPRIKMQAVE
jgi:hypothetical protein